MATSPETLVELFARLDALALDHGPEELRLVVSRACSALFGGEPLTGGERWALALACMTELGGYAAALSPLVDRSGSEWSDAIVDAAHGLIEEVWK